MFKKKALLQVPNLYELKKGKVAMVSVFVNIDKKNFEKLADAGFNPALVKENQSYKYLDSWKGNFALYAYLILQDIMRGKVFNQTRYPAFCILKKQIYGQELTAKEQEAYDLITGGSDEHDTVISVPSKKPELKAVIAFTSTAPKIGKTVTTEKIKASLERENLVVEIHTIAELIRRCLEAIAKGLGIDSSRFFENYSQKDQVVKFGNEPVEFKTRDLVCDFSLLMQKYYGTYVWGNCAADDIADYEADVVFIDDLRRKDELDILRKRFGDKLIVIRLEKEDVDPTTVVTQLSSSAQAFENKLSDEDIDETFVFNKDWSNTSELLALVNKYIN